ncbi:hypothetical protein AMECASPLE_038252 [Ameca splendens]|uniref:Uncharacterized protein n=1 Tax=Ameca splendens TaxID=208324 RepID=A0ABV0Z612_9TELE
MALWSKSSPASSCLSRNAPPIRCPGTGGNQPVYTSSDVRAATSVELCVKMCDQMDGPNTFNKNKDSFILDLILTGICRVLAVSPKLPSMTPDETDPPNLSQVPEETMTPQLKASIQ